MRDTGVVHQYVDAGRIAVRVDAREGGFHRVSERDVTFECGSCAASRANAFDGAARSFEIAIEREDMRTVACEGRGDRQANPRAGSGDNRRLSVESKHARTVKQPSAT
jgi:hypothetical protein